MQRTIRNRNTTQIDQSFDPSLSSSEKSNLTYCLLKNNQSQQSQKNTHEVQQLLKELDTLNKRKNQIHERLNQLS